MSLTDETRDVRLVHRSLVVATNRSCFTEGEKLFSFPTEGVGHVTIDQLSFPLRSKGRMSSQSIKLI